MINLLRSRFIGLRGCGQHRFKDAHESGAAAEIACKPFANLRHAGVWIALDKLRGSHQHSRRADAALRAAAIEERLLNRMKLAICCQAFNCLNIGALVLQHRHQATVYQLAVHAYRAGAALAFAATFLGSGKMQVFSQHIEQALHRRRLDFTALTVDGEMDGRPGRAHRLACSSTCWWGARPGNRFSGSSGIAWKLMPVASLIAFTIAGAGPS